MIARGYSIHIYCDRDVHCLSERQSPESAEYDGEEKAECLNQARKAGWHFRANHYVVCKHCWAGGHRP
jgi:hypothetical protein